MIWTKQQLKRIIEERRQPPLTREQWLSLCGLALRWLEMPPNMMAWVALQSGADAVRDEIADAYRKGAADHLEEVQRLRARVAELESLLVDTDYQLREAQGCLFNAHADYVQLRAKVTELEARQVVQDAVFDALENLVHDNYERSYSGSKNRDADAEIIRYALRHAGTAPTAVQPAPAPDPAAAMIAEMRERAKRLLQDAHTDWVASMLDDYACRFERAQWPSDWAEQDTSEALQLQSLLFAKFLHARPRHVGLMGWAMEALREVCAEIEAGETSTENKA